MNTEEQVDRTLESWLATGPTELPDRSVAAIVNHLDNTKQPGPIWFPRRIKMLRFATALGSAAVLVLVAVLAINFYTNQQGIGGQPSPTVSPAPTVAASPSMAPTVAASPSLEPTETPDQSGCINYAAGGTYRRSVGTISVSATVPTEWRGGADAFFLVNTSCLFSASLELKVALVHAVPSNACDWRSTGVEAATPAAVTAALAAQEGHETIGPTDTTVGGYLARRFDFTAPADLDIGTCQDGLRLTGGTEGEEFGGPDRDETITMYVVDVDGLAVGVYERRLTDATEAQIAELDALVASLRFEP